MARKFNNGRQGEQLLNKEFHELYMALKFLNYNYKDLLSEGPGSVPQERQTEIPSHALKIESREDINYIKVFDNQKEWTPLFKGYYQPADARQQVADEEGAAPFQICIDPNGVIMYNDPAYGWMHAKAVEYTGDINTFNGLNYQFISPLKKSSVTYSTRATNELYPVPYTYYGRLFSNKQFKKNTEDNYKSINDCAIETKLQNLSWIHVNASKLISVNKRLIQVQQNSTKVDYGFISVTSSNTEFYGVRLPDRYGQLLIRNVDYVDVAGGIRLTNPTYYRYIYTITYGFDDTPDTEGILLQKTVKIGGKNEIYIGQIQGNVAVFMDGLSLEESDENGNIIYEYDSSDGTITFTDDEDAEIINNMQMTTLTFPRRTAEFTIAQNSKNVVVSSNQVLVKLTTGNNIDGFSKPMVFCSGLGLQQTDIFEDVKINNNTILINNFTFAGNEKYKMFIVDTKDSYVGKGVLNSDTILDSNIESGNNYVVFVNGILMTPTNGDISVSDGKIKIVNALDAAYDNLDYVVFEIDNNNENKIGLAFDNTVSYYTVRIDDYDNEVVYNDCNSALVYVDGNILIDEAAIKKPINALEGYYKGGQIIKTTDEYGNEKYIKYDYTEEEPVELDKAEIDIIKNIIGYYASTGSIHLLGNNSIYTGRELTYFAYSFANLIDETLILGDSDDLHIPIGEGKFTYYGKANQFEAWTAYNESLSTYVNGLIMQNKEFEISNNTTRKFTIEHPYMNAIKNENYFGEKDIIDALDRIYVVYGNKTNEELASTPDILNYGIDGKGTSPLIKDFFSSINLFLEGLDLSRYLNEDMTKNKCTYVIEKLERNEYTAAYRDWIDFDTILGRAHIYRASQDTVEADFLLAPGTVNIYLNGVLLEPVDYVKFNKNKVMFNINVCGLQQLPNNKELCLPEYLSEYDMEYMKGAYDSSDSIIRIIEDKPYYIPANNRDIILIEKRSDTSIKQATFDIETISYGSFDFTEDYYDLPDSLLNTQDKIKIYINGVYYGNDYTIVNKGGVRGIRLDDTDALFIDPVYTYFQMHPEEHEKYMIDNGAYQRVIDKITFEWR